MKAVLIGVITVVLQYNKWHWAGSDEGIRRPPVPTSSNSRPGLLRHLYSTVQYNTDNKLAADTACQWPSQVQCSVLVFYPTVDG